MRVLVTGASGFVAGHLIPRILDRTSDHTVVTAFIRRKSDGRIPPILLEMRGIYKDRLAIIMGDITNYQDVRDSLYKSLPDIIFHLASQSFVPDSVNNPIYTHDVNAGGMLNILEALRHCNHKIKILYTSSSEIYGYQCEHELPLNEESDPNPQSPYASAKLYGEWLCKNYYHSYGIPVVISRAFNHEGVGRGHHFVTASIVRQMVAVKKGETDRIYVGNLNVTRDWSHVSDVVDAYRMLAAKGEPGETYVIGSGIQTSLSDFINRTKMLLSIDQFRIFQDLLLVRKVDVPRLQADPKKMRDLGWKSYFGLDDIITEMIAYYTGMTRQQRESFEPKHEEGEELTTMIKPATIGNYMFGVDGLEDRKLKH